MMQVQLFSISIDNNGSALDDLNRFLRSHRVLHVDRQFVARANEASWNFCVTYLPHAGHAGQVTTLTKVDYKSELSEDEFKRFSMLRTIRKELAISDAVPAYAVFTDAELALMSRSVRLSENDLLQIPGIARKRLEKYGRELIFRLTQQSIQP